MTKMYIWYVMRGIFLYVLVLLLTQGVGAQEVPERGVPYLNNYMPEQYGNVGKIWDMQSNDQNVLYLASDRGLLEFDGQEWKKYKGSRGFTRSLLVVNDSTLYTGSDLDFGVWKGDNLHGLEYTSLYPFKENVGQITEEFWDVYQLDDLIIFVSFNNIYVYKNDQLTKISAPSRFSGSFKVGESIYLVDQTYGVFSFDGISLNSLFVYPENKSMDVVGIANHEEGLLIVTRNQGLFHYEDGNLIEWKSNLSELLKKDQAFNVTTIKDDYFIFGTILNGLYISDKGGKIIQNINKSRGLPNNTILDVYYGKNGILWVSMDLGITGIQLSGNMAYVFDHTGNFGTGQTAVIDQGVFYLGTNQGLYKREWNELVNGVEGISFDLMNSSAGQVWDLQEVDRQVLCGHDKGLFYIEGQDFKTISTKIGVLDIVEYDAQNIFVGTYNGIHYYQKINGKWTFIHELALIKGACSQIILSGKKEMWVLIPNYGVIKAVLNADMDIKDRTIFTIEELKGELQFLDVINDNVHIFSEEHEFVFNPTNNQLEEVDYSYQNENVKHRLPNNFQAIDLNEAYHFYPVYNGFALYYNQNLSEYSANDTLLLRSFKAFNVDSSFHYTQEEKIPYIYNNVRLDFVIPHRENVQYRHYVDGYMDKWSDWSENSEVELLNLFEGKYILNVEGRYGNNQVLRSDIPIECGAPWYRTVYAYSGYAAILLLFIYGLYRWQKYKLEEQKQRLLYQEQVSLRLQADRYKEEEIVKRQQKLEEEKQELEKELRSTKIQLVIKAKEEEDRKRLIQNLNDKLRSMEGNKVDNRMKWKELFRILDNHQEKENNTFQIHMDELNQEFTQKLKKDYPALTMYDVRLCTYIKTGLSTREIAEMMHVLPSSINVSRSRLRKKLGLNAKDDLYSFLEAL